MALAMVVAGLACGMAWAEGAEPTSRADFYVAPDGKDTNPGTAAEPFATVARARDAVRGKIAAGLEHDVLVLIRGGVYPLAETLAFGPEDSGTEKHSITYAAAPGEKVVLSGGRKIAGWKRGEGEIWTADLPEAKEGKWSFRQLFVNGQRAVRARTPNADDKSPWWSIKSSTAKVGAPDANSSTFKVSVDHPIKAWKNISDVELVWIYNNDGSRWRLGTVDEADGTFTLPPPHQLPPTWLPGEYQIGFPLPGQSCYFENALEMLDQPGEWYLDRQSGVLHYWPRPGEDMPKAEVIAPVVQKTLLAVNGTPQRPVRNLHFKGIHVAHVDWPLPAYGFTAMFGCLQVISQEKPEPSVRFLWMDAAVSMEYARSCHFTDGGVAHCGGMGLLLRKGTSGNVVEGNHIHDLGGGGIGAGALRNRDTLKWADPVGKDDLKGYRIANNYVHHCGTDYFGAIGIFVSLAQDAVIAHNLIHDIAYTGIVLGGNEDKSLPFSRNNTVEYNHIHDVMKVCVDGAGIYVTFPQEGWGAVVRGNLIHDLRPNPFNSRQGGDFSAAGIYLDGVRPTMGCRGYRFENNVIYQTGAPLFFCQCSEAGNGFVDNTFLKTGAPAQEVLDAARAKAGLEPAYRHLLGEQPR